MSKNRRRFSSEYKFRVALEAAKGQATLSELAAKYGLHPNQISQWKRQLLDSGADVFSRNGPRYRSCARSNAKRLLRVASSPLSGLIPLWYELSHVSWE